MLSWLNIRNWIVPFGDLFNFAARVMHLLCIPQVRQKFRFPKSGVTRMSQKSWKSNIFFYFVSFKKSHAHQMPMGDCLSIHSTLMKQSHSRASAREYHAKEWPPMKDTWKSRPASPWSLHCTVIYPSTKRGDLSGRHIPQQETLIHFGIMYTSATVFTMLTYHEIFTST